MKEELIPDRTVKVAFSMGRSMKIEDVVNEIMKLDDLGMEFNFAFSLTRLVFYSKDYIGELRIGHSLAVGQGLSELSKYSQCDLVCDEVITELGLKII